MIRPGVVALVLALWAPGVDAHDRRVSTGQVRVGAQDVSVSVRLRRLDLTSLSPAAARWAHDLRGAPPDDIAGTLTGLYATGCALQPASFGQMPGRAPAEVRFAWRLACAGAPQTLQVRPFPAAGHLHVASITNAHGSEQRIVVSDRAQEVALTATQPAASAGGAIAYLIHGLVHALSGWDHILFVLLLVLLTTGVRQAVGVVTGFTLGHSATLAVAALGWVDVDGRAVETLIAASVVALAAETLGRLDQSSRASLGVALLGGTLAVTTSIYALVPVVVMGLLAGRVDPDASAAVLPRFGLAACFGMIHGLGFSTGFDAAGSGMVGRLLAFNLGVEAAQVAVVVAVLLLLRALAHTGVRRPPVVRLASMACGAAGSYAAVTRALG